MQNNVREQVIDSATQLFAEKGFASVSLQHVAFIAGINFDEITKLFSSEEELYKAVLETQFATLVEKMDGVFKGDESPQYKIELFARAIFDLNRHAPYFLTLYHRELLSPSPLFESVVMKNIRHVAYLLDNTIARGIQKGIFKYEINPANATMYLAGILHYYFLAKRLVGSLLPESINDEEYLSQALKTYFSGLQIKA